MSSIAEPTRRFWERRCEDYATTLAKHTPALADKKRFFYYVFKRVEHEDAPE